MLFASVADISAVVAFARTGGGAAGPYHHKPVSVEMSKLKRAGAGRGGDSAAAPADVNEHRSTTDAARRDADAVAERNDALSKERARRWSVLLAFMGLGAGVGRRAGLMPPGPFSPAPR